MKKAWVLSYPLSAQRRLWLDWLIWVFTGRTTTLLVLSWGGSIIGFQEERRRGTCCYNAEFDVIYSKTMRYYFNYFIFNKIIDDSWIKIWSDRMAERLALPTSITGSLVRLSPEARFFPKLNGASLHRAFRYNWNIVERDVKSQLINKNVCLVNKVQHTDVVNQIRKRSIEFQR